MARGTENSMLKERILLVGKDLNFFPFRRKYQNEIFRTEGAVGRFLSPHIIRKAGRGLNVLGHIGVDVGAFESYWGGILDERGAVRTSNQDFPLFAAYITNFSELRAPADLNPAQNIAEVDYWLSVVFSVASRLPGDLDSLKVFLNNKSASYLFINRGDKYDHFLKWIESV